MGHIPLFLHQLYVFVIPFELDARLGQTDNPTEETMFPVVVAIPSGDLDL